MMSQPTSQFASKKTVIEEKSSSSPSLPIRTARVSLSFKSGAHFSKKMYSRFTHNFTFLTSHIDHPKMYTLTSYFSYHISICWTFQISNLHSYRAFYSSYLVVWNVICEMRNVKWESHFTFPRNCVWLFAYRWHCLTNVVLIFRGVSSGCSDITSHYSLL